MAIRFKEDRDRRRPSARPIGAPAARIPEEDRAPFEAALRLDPEIAKRFEAPPDVDGPRIYVTADKAADGSAPVKVTLSSPNFFEDVPLEPSAHVLAILQALVDRHAPSWPERARMLLKIDLAPPSATLRAARAAEMAEAAKALPGLAAPKTEIDW